MIHAYSGVRLETTVLCILSVFPRDTAQEEIKKLSAIAMNFFIVKSNNDIIDQQEIDNAKYGIIDPTSPTEFKLNFGKINIIDPPVTNDLSSTISLKMPSEDFGGSIETFEMQIIIDDKSVDLSVDKASLSVPKADDGTIAPPTLYTPEIDSLELLFFARKLNTSSLNLLLKILAVQTNNFLPSCPPNMHA